MKKLTLLLLSSICILSANDKEAAPYKRSDTTDVRDKAIDARDKLSQSIRDKANKIYKSRLSEDVIEDKILLTDIAEPKKKIVQVDNNITKDINMTIN